MAVKALRTLACAAAVLLYACVLPLWAQEGLPSAREAASYRQVAEIRPEEALLALAQDESAGESLRLAAQDRLAEMYTWSDQEAAIEAQLLASGCGECTAQLGRAFACIFAPEEAAREKGAAILACVVEVTGLDAGHVRIIPR